MNLPTLLLETQLWQPFRSEGNGLKTVSHLEGQANKGFIFCFLIMKDYSEDIMIHVLCSVTQSCPALCDPMDYSPPGSSVHGISQARMLEWVAISSSRGSFRTRDWTCVSCVSCIGRWILLPVRHRGSPIKCLIQDHVVSGWLRTTMSWLCVYLFC